MIVVACGQAWAAAGAAKSALTETQRLQGEFRDLLHMLSRDAGRLAAPAPAPVAPPAPSTPFSRALERGGHVRDASLALRPGGAQEALVLAQLPRLVSHLDAAYRNLTAACQIVGGGPEGKGKEGEGEDGYTGEGRGEGASTPALDSPASLSRRSPAPSPSLEGPELITIASPPRQNYARSPPSYASSLTGGGRATITTHSASVVSSSGQGSRRASLTSLQSQATSHSHTSSLVQQALSRAGDAVAAARATRSHSAVAGGSVVSSLAPPTPRLVDTPPSAPRSFASATTDTRSAATPTHSLLLEKLSVAERAVAALHTPRHGRDASLLTDTALNLSLSLGSSRSSFR